MKKIDKKCSQYLYPSKLAQIPQLLLENICPCSIMFSFSCHKTSQLTASLSFMHDIFFSRTNFCARMSVTQNCKKILFFFSQCDRPFAEGKDKTQVCGAVTMNEPKITCCFTNSLWKWLNMRPFLSMFL